MTGAGIYDLPVHPAAEIFPMLSEAELTTLMEDIRERGQRVPILIYDGPEGHEILDGRNRREACRRLGIDEDYVDYAIYDGDDPIREVVSHNIARRHLTDAQRASAAAKLANLSGPGRPPNTIPPTIPPIGGITEAASAKPVSVATAAEMLNVSPRSVERARQVIQHGAPELVEALDRGDVSVSAAAEIAKRPREEQRKAVTPEALESKRAPREKGATKPAASPAGFDLELEVKALADAAEALVAKCRKRGVGSKRVRDVLSDRIARWASEEASS